MPRYFPGRVGGHIDVQVEDMKCSVLPDCEYLYTPDEGWHEREDAVVSYCASPTYSMRRQHSAEVVLEVFESDPWNGR
jgi:hypothetical protein